MNVLKKLLPALASFAGLTVCAHAQDADGPRCSTIEYMQLQEKQNPALAEIMKHQEADIQKWIKTHGDQATRGQITIPVVVHLVYNPAVNMTLSDWQVKTAIDVLNEDYNRENADKYKTPSAFASLAANCEIRFCLAKRDPAGNHTTGVLRETHGDVSAWYMNSFDNYKTTAWPRDQYLNIWVAKLKSEDPMASPPLGFSTFPSETTFVDGVVITDTAFGRIGDLKAKYNRSRTTTHEVGHWLDLIHTWGDDNGACTGTDGCGDTPDQANSTSGCPAFPLTDACSPADPGVMFMNYMDYVHDSCMNIFTADQKLRMIAAINTARATLLSSAGCSPPSPYTYDLEVTQVINPAGNVNTRYLNPLVQVTNVGAQTVGGFNLYYQFHEQDMNAFTWTGALAPGETTVVTLPQIKDSIGYNFFIAYAQNVANANGALVVEQDTVNNFASRSYYVTEEANKQPNGMQAQYDLGNSTVFLVFDQLVYNKFDVDVYNAIGQRMPIRWSYAGGLNKVKVDLLNASPGVYVARAVNAGKRLSAKIIKLPPQ